MKRYRSIIISLVTILVSSCNSATYFFTASPVPTPTELQATSEIYSAALAHGDAHGGGSNSANYCSSDDLALYYLTQNYEFDKEDWERIHRLIPAVEKDLWENFLQINLQPIRVPENLDLGCKYRLVTRENLANMSFENYPDVYYLSRIAFNSRQDHAVVYRAYSDSNFCYSDLLYLEIIDGQWKVIGIQGLVIC